LADVVDDQRDAARLFDFGEFTDLVGGDCPAFTGRLALDAQELALVTTDEIRNPVPTHPIADGEEKPNPVLR